MPPLPSLILIDLLGVRARWTAGGADAATSAFDDLTRLVQEAVNVGPDEITGAETESDSAVILCTSTNAALRVAKSLFLRTFTESTASQERFHRIWLRGVLVPRPSDLSIRDLRIRRLKLSGRLTVNELSRPLLDAIALEKSGFRGMRLVVHPRLLTSRVRSAAALQLIDGESAQTLARVTGERVYPTRLKGFEDFLWMATNSPKEWRRLSGRMTRRLRYATRDDEEVVQAAATQVVFDACEAELGY
jgi:hypothetical protein